MQLNGTCKQKPSAVLIDLQQRTTQSSPTANNIHSSTLPSESAVNSASTNLPEEAITRQSPTNQLRSIDCTPLSSLPKHRASPTITAVPSRSNTKCVGSFTSTRLSPTVSQEPKLGVYPKFNHSLCARVSTADFEISDRSWWARTV